MPMDDDGKKAVLPDAGPTPILELERIAGQLKGEDRLVVLTAANEILRLRIIQLAAELVLRADSDS